jgi:uncharacterized membrane protein YgcG
MKKYFLLFISLFIFISPVYASTNTKDRNSLENHGVNKKWKITNKNISNVNRTPAVDASELIYDFSDILTPEEEENLLEQFYTFKNKTGWDIVFLSYSLPYSDDYENEDFAADFYDYNDFGLDKENYDGIILFRNTWETDRFYISLSFGDAQLYVAGSELSDIEDAIYTEISTDRYVEGITHWMSLCEAKFESGVNSRRYIGNNGKLCYYYRFPGVIILIITSVFTLIFISINVSKNKMIKTVFKAEEYINKKDMKMLTSKDFFIHSHVSSYTVSSSSGGGGSHMGSSGGFHSSGGGRHG